MQKASEKCIRVCLPRLLITVTAVLSLCISARVEAQLVLRVREGPPDQNHIMVGAPPPRSYVGLLKNIGRVPELLQIIQATGGHDVSDRRGGCYLEQWNQKSRRWNSFPSPIATVESLDVETTSLTPGAAIQVCRALFSQEEARRGARYRFILYVQMKGLPSPSALTATFKIGAPTGGRP